MTTDTHDPAAVEKRLWAEIEKLGVALCFHPPARPKQDQLANKFFGHVAVHFDDIVENFTHFRDETISGAHKVHVEVSLAH